MSTGVRHCGVVGIRLTVQRPETRWESSVAELLQVEIFTVQSSFQGVAQQEERQERAQSAEDERVLLPAGHGIGPEPVALHAEVASTVRQQVAVRLQALRK